MSSYSIGAERRMESNKATHSVNDNRHSGDSKSDDDDEETVYVIEFGRKDEKDAEKERDTEEIGKKRESFLFVHERVTSYNKQYRTFIFSSSRIIAHFLLQSMNTFVHHSVIFFNVFR